MTVFFPGKGKERELIASRIFAGHVTLQLLCSPERDFQALFQWMNCLFTMKLHRTGYVQLRVPLPAIELMSCSPGYFALLESYPTQQPARLTGLLTWSLLRGAATVWKFDIWPQSSISYLISLWLTNLLIKPSLIRSVGILFQRDSRLHCLRAGLVSPCVMHALTFLFTAPDTCKSCLGGTWGCCQITGAWWPLGTAQYWPGCYTWDSSKAPGPLFWSLLKPDSKEAGRFT